MDISRTVCIQLTEEETYRALELYVRLKASAENGIDLSQYTLDDADSSCTKDGKGAYFLFLKKVSND
jgi:hypothetical protein